MRTRTGLSSKYTRAFQKENDKDLKPSDFSGRVGSR